MSYKKSICGGSDVDTSKFVTINVIDSKGDIEQVEMHPRRTLELTLQETVAQLFFHRSDWWSELYKKFLETIKIERTKNLLYWYHEATNVTYNIIVNSDGTPRQLA